jgi:hypothetical protein
VSHILQFALTTPIRYFYLWAMAMVVLLFEVVFECNKKHTTFNSQCVLFFMPPIPSKKMWDIQHSMMCVLTRLCKAYQTL